MEGITGDDWNFIDPHQSSMNFNEVHGRSHGFSVISFASRLGQRSWVSAAESARVAS